MLTQKDKGQLDKENEEMEEMEDRRRNGGGGDKKQERQDKEQIRMGFNLNKKIMSHEI